jgi:hypothetical protein
MKGMINVIIVIDKVTEEKTREMIAGTVIGGITVIIGRSTEEMIIEMTEEKTIEEIIVIDQSTEETTIEETIVGTVIEEISDVMIERMIEEKIRETTEEMNGGRYAKIVHQEMIVNENLQVLEVARQLMKTIQKVPKLFGKRRNDD